MHPLCLLRIYLPRRGSRDPCFSYRGKSREAGKGVHFGTPTFYTSKDIN